MENILLLIHTEADGCLAKSALEASSRADPRGLARGRL